MPRPKPPNPLKGRQVRLSDIEWAMLQHLGGAEWLRNVLNKTSPLPKRFYQSLIPKDKNDK